MEKLIKKIRIQATITTLTGIHIGGSSENVEIGGLDNPVIKIATKENQPYIPGSSIKGKLRCLLEQAAGATEVGMDKKVNNLFGTIKSKRFNNDNQPSKLIVRDAMLTEKSAKELFECKSLDMPYTENKFENTIDRVKGVTVGGGVRQTERVPAGAEFSAEFIINVWNDDKEDELLALFYKGIHMLENDYLGGSGSRGYGQVKVSLKEPVVLSNENDWKA